jgi:hypothetical protein
VPKDVQEEMQKWGLPKDEFTDNGNWSHQLYIREARRMTGSYVMTENELLKKRATPDSVGMGSYGIDSHNIQRYITPEGFVQNEGDIGVSTKGPYEIAYGSLVPKKGQADNLLVPVCVSSSHIAFGSIRMEPVFMILGQSAATAAVMAMDSGIAVQDVPYEKLKEQLLKDGQVLHYTGPVSTRGGRDGLDPDKLAGIVIDDAKAKTTGEWGSGRSAKQWIGENYQHDNNTKDGKAAARFEPAGLKPGRYEVRFAYTAHPNRASNVPVTIHHAGGEKTVTVNEQESPPIDGSFVSLGTFEFAAGKDAHVIVTNQGTDGYVVVDAVQWLPAEK